MGTVREGRLRERLSDQAPGLTRGKAQQGKEPEAQAGKGTGSWGQR